MNSVHYSSATDQWETPQDFFDKLNAEFNFEIDVCADEYNAKCAAWISKKYDGLKQPWKGTCWMNPPYGREIGKWIQKAHESAQAGATVVCLIPSRTDTRWWHDHVMQAEIRFVKGRLKFGGCKDNAPFPNAIVIFRGKGNDGLQNSSKVLQRSSNV